MKLMKFGLVLIGVLSGGRALAAPVAVEREQMLQQLQAVTQQIAVAQQQIDQSPNGRTQLGSALQLLNAAQNQIGEILRVMAAAPPAASASQGHQGQAVPPQYGQPVQPQYGQPVQPQYGQPVQPQYGQPVQPQYGQPVQPQYGQPVQPQYGQPMPPQYGQPVQPPPQQPPPQVNYSLAMNEGNFRALLQAVSAALSNDKLNQLRQGIVGNHLLVEQVAKILPMFVYTTDRVTALKVVAPVILDRHNGHRLLALFQYGDDREQVQRILNLGPMQ